MNIYKTGLVFHRKCSPVFVSSAMKNEDISTSIALVNSIANFISSFYAN